MEGDMNYGKTTAIRCYNDKMVWQQVLQYVICITKL